MTNAANWVRPEIQAMQAYHVVDPGDLIKLDMMENPYTWPDDLRQQWQQALSQVDLNRYPDPHALKLQARLRKVMKIPESSDILLGNGSDELIQMIAFALAGKDKAILSVDPGFVMYRIIGLFAGMPYIGIPLRGDFTLDTDALLMAIEKHQPAVVYIAYPNNPTGNLFPAEDIREIIRAAPGLVVVDEAYAPFTDASFMSELADFDNLIVMRTVSKMGLAGLRLGYMAGHPDWISELDKTRLPFNINVLTQVTADFALRHKDVLDQQTMQIRQQRDLLISQLSKLDNLTVYPSDANFILLRTEPGRAGEIFEGIKKQGVLIKKLDGSHPMLADCLRLTVGKPEENTAFVDAIATLL